MLEEKEVRLDWRDGETLTVWGEERSPSHMILSSVIATQNSPETDAHFQFTETNSLNLTTDPHPSSYLVL